MKGTALLSCMRRTAGLVSGWQKYALWLLTALVFLGGLGIRLYDLKDPPLDFHMSRQLRSAILARQVYYRLDASLDTALRQQAEELAQLEVYEPPILEQIVGFTYYLIGSEQVWVARIYLALFWVLGGAALFAMARRFASTLSALTGLAFYFFLPFGVIASRSFQPDSWMVMWILLTAWALCRWNETRSWKWTVLTGLLAGFTLLVKVVSGFFLAGMLVGVVGTALGLRKVWRSPQAWAMMLLSAAPAAIYYLFINTQRSADFLSFWTVSLSGLIWTTNFYADWLAMIQSLTGLGLFLAALLGAALLPAAIRPLGAGAWVGYLGYGLVFPYQYVTHEYYHLPLIALMTISFLPLLEAVFERLQRQGWLWKVFAAGVLLFASVYSLWVARSVLYANNYESEPASWRRVGQAVPAGSSLVALTGDYGMRLRYYGWRSMSAAWPTSGDERLFNLAGRPTADFEERFHEIAEGKEFFLITAFSELEAQPALKDYLQSHYPVYEQGDGYLVYDLRHPIK